MIARTEKPLSFRPRLVLAYADSAHASQSCRQFRRLGWEVHLASSGTEARRLARALAPKVVVLDTELKDESGWLTCAKISLEDPEQKVILVGADLTPEQERFAVAVGAIALVQREQGVSALIDEVQGTSMPASA